MIENALRSRQVSFKLGITVKALISAAAFSGVSPLNAAMVWSQIQTGFAGLLIQAVLAPVIIIGLKAFMDKSGSGK